MSSTTVPVTDCDMLQLVTFEVGDATLALEISSVREINRNLNLTHVPHAPKYVRGVTNLRGEVAAILDSHALLGLTAAEPTAASRNLIVLHDGELIGLWVDAVADIMTVPVAELTAPPANINSTLRSLLRGVYQAPERLVMLLELDELLCNC